MERFLKRHRDRIIGTIAGFDRVLFRGSLLSICHREGMDRFLSSQRVLYKDFGAFAQKISTAVKARAEEIAHQAGRPMQYVNSAKQAKDQLVREIAERDGIKEGLICVLSCVEPCDSFSIRGDRQRKQLRLVPEQRKCLHFYFYYLDRDWGLMHIRLQSWLPLTMQVCINGREYLAKQMAKAGIGFEQHENCFTRIDNLPTAQRLMDQLSQRRWKGFLDPLARRVNPWLDRRGEIVLRPYYWTMRESEYATDLMFRDRESLQQIYPALTNYAIQGMSSEDVLRFLGRVLTHRFGGEVTTNLRRRMEGLRVKHWVEENSIKMYDKAGSVLRIETTINNPKRLRVRRRTNCRGQELMKWLPMRKSIADTRRRVEICRAANERYLEALAVVGEPKPVRQLFDQVSKPIQTKGRRLRALRPISPEDSRLFRIIMRGEFHLQGVRNRDLRDQLFPDHLNPVSGRQQAGRITRCLRLLREHKLIYKVPKTNYYRVTNYGHHLMAASIKLRESDIALLAA